MNFTNTRHLLNFTNFRLVTPKLYWKLYETLFFCVHTAGANPIQIRHFSLQKKKADRGKVWEKNVKMKKSSWRGRAEREMEKNVIDLQNIG